MTEGFLEEATLRRESRNAGKGGREQKAQRIPRKKAGCKELNANAQREALVAGEMVEEESKRQITMVHVR